MSADRYSRCPKCWHPSDPRNDAREDWELTLTDKWLAFDYTAKCRACDFLFVVHTTFPFEAAAEGGQS